ncbi:SH3 domain-containing protein [Pseudomonas sp. 22490]|uniref:SH3 domain-containing protein n=1 Tax=Pseudomonas sp. 22490 TaxID=3453929 RepID=UPI003F82ABEB
MQKTLKYYITKSTKLRWEDFLEAIKERETARGIDIDATDSLVAQARRMLHEAESDGLSSLLGGSTRSIALEYLDGTRAFQDIPRSTPEMPGGVIGSILTELQGRGVDIGLPQEPPEVQSGWASGALPALVGEARGGQVQRPSPWSALPTNLILWVLILMINALIQGGIHWNDLREGICDINSRLSPSDTLADTRKFVRTRLCGAPASHVRIVSRENVNLRSAPGMRSEIITQLPKGLVVAVVSRDDRDWLEVSFERDGYVIEGWVTRKYLTRVR